MGFLAFVGGAAGMIFSNIQYPQLCTISPVWYPSVGLFVVGVLMLAIGSMAAKTAHNKDKEDAKKGTKNFLDSIDEV